MFKDNNVKVTLASLIAVVGASQMAVGEESQISRGADIHELAANCNIGPFHQTGKAGSYNTLCNVMQDSEKCLALLKRGFNFNGETVTLNSLEKDQERFRYCLQALTKELLEPNPVE